MSRFRDELIRSHFEAVRDLTWFETLEPKFQEYGLNADAMKHHREAWNAHAEKRDWPSWRNEVRRFSNGELDDMRMDCIDKLDALGMLNWQHKKATTGEAAFKEILNREESAQERMAEPTQTLNKGRKM